MTATDIAALAAYGLPGAPVLDIDLEEPAATTLLDDARRHKLVGLLDQALADGCIRVPDTVSEAIGHAALDAATWCLLVDRHLLAVHDLLEDAGIEHRFVKGSVIAYRFEPHPALRTFVDVDVLVQGEDLDRSVALLVEHGHRRLQPELRPGFSARFGKSVTLRSDDGIEVDVHRTFASGPFGLAAAPDPLWARPADDAAIGPATVPTLDGSAAFVHACVHAVTGARLHLASLRAVALTLPGSSQEEVRSLAASLRVEACVGEAVRATWRQLDLKPDARADSMAGWLPTSQERRWLDLYASEDRSFRALSVAGIRAVRGFRERSAYVWALARPGRDLGR